MPQILKTRKQLSGQLEPVTRSRRRSAATIVAAYFEHVELELMVESGLTPLQTLVAATSGAAQALALRDQGSLERGKYADLLVLDANPLTDIKNTRQIHSVWLAGKQLEPASLD